MSIFKSMIFILSCLCLQCKHESFHHACYLIVKYRILKLEVCGSILEEIDRQLRSEGEGKEEYL
jgi:hypothetical protein